MLIKPEHLNYLKNKYQRIFIFGCSFTNYYWPTWANILHWEIPNVTCYNFGQSGGGNLFIAATLVAANQKYKFNETDLVIPHWSTYCREDRYIQNGWLTPGNIWTQGSYDDEFLKKFACAKGYIVRDLAIITSIKYMLQQLPCDSLMLHAVNPRYDSRYFEGYGFEDVIDLYKDTIESMPETLYDCVKAIDQYGSYNWINAHEYFNKHHNNGKGGMYQDYHPSPVRYMSYLQNIGINLSSPVKLKAHTVYDELLQLTNHDDILMWSRNLYNSTPNYYNSEHLI